MINQFRERLIDKSTETSPESTISISSPSTGTHSSVVQLILQNNFIDMGIAIGYMTQKEES